MMFGAPSPGTGLWRPWIHRVVGAAMVVGVLAYLPYRVLDGPSAVRLSEMKSELARAEVELARLQQENAALGRDIKALKEEPRAIEDIARRDLAMVYPNDVVIRLERKR